MIKKINAIAAVLKDRFPNLSALELIDLSGKILDAIANVEKDNAT